MKMNKKQLLFLAAALITVILVAGLTAVALKTFGSNREATPIPTETETEDNNGTVNPDHSQLPAEGINEEANSTANQLEDEANKLMETNPLEAAKKYEEAAKAYNEAGNYSKAADMTDNARTASAMTPSEQPEIGEPVITR